MIYDLHDRMIDRNNKNIVQFRITLFIIPFRYTLR